MMKLVWSAAFTRHVKRKVRHNLGLKDEIRVTLQQLADDPFHPVLKTHKLSGKLADCWACSVTDDLRIVFEFEQNPESGEKEVLLSAFGTHDEVY